MDVRTHPFGAGTMIVIRRRRGLFCAGAFVFEEARIRVDVEVIGAVFETTALLVPLCGAALPTNLFLSNFG